MGDTLGFQHRAGHAEDISLRTINKKRVDALGHTFPWVKFAKESLDGWAAEQLQTYTPEVHSVAVLDLAGTEQKVFALLERVTTRRADALQLQGQAYLRALQYDLIASSRDAKSQLLLASSEQADATATKIGMEKAAAAFATGDHKLALGFQEQSTTSANVAELAEDRERQKLKQQRILEQMQSKFEDDLQELH
jgi:hypothetical protein